MYRFDKAPIPVFPSVGFHIDISFDVPQFPCSLRPQKLIMYDKNVCIMHSATLSVISPYIVPHHIWTMHDTNGFPSNEKIQKRSIVALLFFSCPEQLNRTHCPMSLGLSVCLTKLTIRVFTTLQSEPRDV